MNTKLTTKTGNVVEISSRADSRIIDVESCDRDDTGNIVVVSCSGEQHARDLAGEYGAWGLDVVDIEDNCIVIAA